MYSVQLMTQSRTHSIAIIAGDGIGKEVIPAGLATIEAATRGTGLSLKFTELPWGCDYYLKHGRMMDADGFERAAEFDAIYLGAIGSPAVPDHIAVWDLLLPLRQRFQQYVNLRPMRLLPGLVSPLANRGPADIDMICVRENSEGEYAGLGDACTSGHRTRLPSRPASSRAKASNGFCGTDSRLPPNGRGGFSQARQSPMRFATRWCCGSRSRKSSARIIRTSITGSITSTRLPRAWSRIRRRST